MFLSLNKKEFTYSLKLPLPFFIFSVLPEVTLLTYNVVYHVFQAKIFSFIKDLSHNLPHLGAIP